MNFEIIKEALLAKYWPTMLRIAIMLILGIMAVRFFPFCQSSLAWLIAITILLILSFIIRTAMAQSIIVMLMGFAAGGLIMADDAESMSADATTVLSGKAAMAKSGGNDVYEGIIITEPVRHRKVIQQDILIVKDGKSYKIRASILCDTVNNRWKQLHIGDNIIFSSKMEKPRNFANTDFDYAQWLTDHGYIAQTFIFYKNWKKAAANWQQLSTFEVTSLKMSMFRSSIEQKLKAAGLADDEFAIVAAMTLGDKSMLTKAIKNTYSITGASHVLALSGLHLSIIYGVLTLITLGYRKQWFSQLLIMVSIWAYALMTGLSPSVMRSAMMLTIYSLISLAGRDSLSLSVLASTAVILLIANPRNIFDVGFEMSFAAVAAILVFGQLLYKIIPTEFLSKHRLVRWLWSTLTVSLTAQLGTAPLVAYYFGRFSCYFMLTNLIVIPTTVFILYASIALIATLHFTAVASLIATVLSFVTSLLNAALAWVSTLPTASIEGLRPRPITIIAIYVVEITVPILIFKLYELRMKKQGFA